MPSLFEAVVLAIANHQVVEDVDAEDGSRGRRRCVSPTSSGLGVGVTARVVVDLMCLES